MSTWRRPSWFGQDSKGARTSASRISAASQEEAAGAGVKALYWVLGLVVLGYAVSLVVRANGASTTLIDGWGDCRLRAPGQRPGPDPGRGQPARPALLPGPRARAWPVGDRRLRDDLRGHPQPQSAHPGAGQLPLGRLLPGGLHGRHAADAPGGPQVHRPPTIWTAWWSRSRVPRRSPPSPSGRSRGGRGRLGDRGLEPDLPGRRHPAADPHAGRRRDAAGRPAGRAGT